MFEGIKSTHLSLVLFKNVNKMVKFPLSTPWMHTVGVEVWRHLFVTLARDGGEWLTSRPGRLTHGKETRYPLNWRLGGPRPGMDVLEETKSLSPVSDSLAATPSTLLHLFRLT